MSAVEIIAIIFAMPDVSNRLHAFSKALTFGVLGILFSTVGLRKPELSIRSVMAGLFILLAAPVAATVIARAAYRRGVPLGDRAVADEVADRDPAPPASSQG